MVKQNVLMMQFLGTDGKAAPRLKDVVFETNVEEFYKETVMLLRTMYQECRLVHADFSEYNLLYHNDAIHVIDVSQSVEHDHPHALDFLRRDCFNTNDFFRRNGAEVLSLQALFDFITDLTPMDLEVRYVSAKEQSLGGGMDEGVFREVYIPRTLHDLPMEEEKQESNLFDKLTGVVQTHHASDSQSEDSQSEDDKEDTEQDNVERVKNKHGDVIYEGMSKTERKLKVKEDKRVKRKEKLPKKVKKQKIKQSTTKTTHR
jgi:RIO kinase 1